MNNKNSFSWMEFVNDVAKLTKPKEIFVCDGSKTEWNYLIGKMLDQKTLIQLNRQTYPNCYLHRSHPSDTARSEGATFICAKNKKEAGPTNNWMNIKRAQEIVKNLFDGCMAGRTMYVIPFSLGPLNSPYSLPAIEITDSPYVAANMHTLVRIGLNFSKEIGQRPMLGIHSLGSLDFQKKFILHFPDTNTVWSINSGYGGNALLGKKCMALRLASVLARKQGWLSEHMMVLGLENPEGEITYIAGAFPSACGKTNLAMLASDLKGYKVWTVSDDLCWMHIGSDGRLWAINPEKGFFAVAPNANWATNANMMAAISSNTIFTNTALTSHNEPWWDGKENNPPDGLLDWQGKIWDKTGPAAHPNARFTVPAEQCPTISAYLEEPAGVPISAIIFGGRRPDTMPLILETLNWQQGIFFGLSLASETTAAAEGTAGLLRRDPFAMLPFCGFNMADLVRHHLKIGKMLKNPPRIFHLNLFLKDSKNKFLWPGFRENIRLLKWISERVREKGNALKTPLGFKPADDAINWDELGISPVAKEKLFKIDSALWLKEISSLEIFFRDLNAPPEMKQELKNLKKRFHLS